MILAVAVGPASVLCGRRRRHVQLVATHQPFLDLITDSSAS
jgi:hypothetical protein